MPLEAAFWDRVTGEELFGLVRATGNLQHVDKTMRLLTEDPKWTAVILALVAQGHIETRCFLSWLSSELQPGSYLEVGVRRGFSMAMVASQCPDVSLYGFDLWLEGYAGIDNPGPAFVRNELMKVGHTGPVAFVDGDSHETLPAFFGDRRAGWRARRRVAGLSGSRPGAFDLILVDGDHSLLGAYQDLMDTLPRLSPGGVLVFDDIAPDLGEASREARMAEAGADPHGWGDLLGVWSAAKRSFPHYRYFEFTANMPGVALAVNVGGVGS